MQNQLEEEFKEKIKEKNFSVLEIAGFSEKPELALMAGMAMGYILALDKRLKEIECK